MNFVIALFGITVAINGALSAFSPIIPATTYIRSPVHNSAIIQSDRLGGNFAYSTVEGHAYQTVHPIVRNLYRPVVAYSAAYPISTIQTIPTAHSLVYTQQPTISTYPIYQLRPEQGQSQKPSSDQDDQPNKNNQQKDEKQQQNQKNQQYQQQQQQNYQNVDDSVTVESA